MRERILQQLSSIERQEAVRIFYACESGSRAWGFASPDSDYDVRFLYARPLDWYFSITEGRDVIERPEDELLDIGGWDIRKALRLLRKSNAPLLEWIGSPVCYRSDDASLALFRGLADRSFLPESSFRHYLAMANNSLEAMGSGTEVRTKAYLYATRTLLCCLWIERTGSRPPVQVSELISGLLIGPDDAQVKGALESLIIKKQAGTEKATIDRIPVLDGFLSRQIEVLAQVSPKVASLPPIEDFDGVFRAIVRQQWS